MFSVETVLTVGSTVVVGVAWLVRLEAKTLNNARDLEKYKEELSSDLRENKEDIKSVKSKQDVMDSKVLEKLGDLQMAIAKIEGRLGIIDE